MAVQRLSSDIQSLLSSSIHMFTFKRVVEELVYNALDAESTSIAIRIHIGNGKVQVVDNGNGIAEEDFTLLGQRYATSKLIDVNQLKSAPNTYGYKGQALASIVDVAKCVKITSRSNNAENTWTKTFYKGKGRELNETTFRPSKGTTVEVNDFLYNLHIQNKAIDRINELNEIKTLLEQLSLVHNQVSFSLRDDSKNEVIFKAHKNKDIYQTLKSLYDIDKSDIQELQIVKGQYKAVAYIAKKQNHVNRHHCIFLNKRLVFNTKLHRLIQDHLKKKHLSKIQKKVKSKKFDYDVDIECFDNHSIPFFFIFITCPYNDYEMSYTPKQSILEFNNWTPVNKLLTKLIQFYTGDLKVNEIKINNDKLLEADKDANTREKVKSIMKKILGSYPKKPRVSQMQNGIKGKLIKRKIKKRKVPFSKVLSPKIFHNDPYLDKDGSNQCHEHLQIVTKDAKSKPEKSKVFPKAAKYQIANFNKRNPNSNEKKNDTLYRRRYQNVSKHITKDSKSKKRRYIKDVLIKVFENPTDTLIKRCNILAEKVNHYFPQKNKKKTQQLFLNETINYNNVNINNENFSIRRKVRETIIHDYIPLTPANNCYQKNARELNKTTFKTSHDLVKTVIDMEDKEAINNRDTNKVGFQDLNAKNNKLKLSHLTFESHHYVSHYNNQRNIIDLNKTNKTPSHYESIGQTHFISRHSIKNFVEPIQLPPQCFRSRNLLEKKNPKKDNAKKFDRFTKSWKTTTKNPASFHYNNFSIDFTSHTIDFSESNVDNIEPCRTSNVFYDNLIAFESVDIDKRPTVTSHMINTGFTYTLTESNNMTTLTNKKFETNEKYIMQNKNDMTELSQYCDANEKNTLNKTDQRENPLNITFQLSSKASVIEDTSTSFEHIEPLSICEAILNSKETPELTINISTDSTNHYDCSSKFLSLPGSQKNNCEQLINVSNKCISPTNAISSNYTIDEEMIKAMNQEMNITFKGDVTVDIQKETEKRNEENLVIIDGDHEQEHDRQQKHIDFNIKNRPRFLPKGLSPIFKTCFLKNATNITDKDYFEEEIIDKFVKDIQVHTGIYEAHLQHPNEITTKAIDKVNNKLIKDNSCLTFDANSLKEAKVLGQVDCKFIATIMKGKSDTSEFLVLFDQHAVHERIRLEENLADYYNGDIWLSTKLEDVVLKLSRDEIMYLHNYKDKFTHFGLQWTVLNNHEIKLHAIPNAILGKNPRQVEKVINAVRNLISEEVEIIKAQKGCVSLYPKSIMDLVFSEACRYAIMFGDNLSKSDCSSLIRGLSSCKTPFQCAHGRPVMAVLMEIKTEQRDYQINKKKLRVYHLNKKGHK